MRIVIKTLIIAFFTLTITACMQQKETMASIDVEGYGTIKVMLYDSTPKHKENFIKLANEGFFDGTLFHRVIQGFMVQGGDPDSKGAAPGRQLGMGGPGYTLDAEIGAPHFRGTLAAARLGDAQNPQRRSSGSQFFIVQGRDVNDQMLNSIENTNGIKYSEAQRNLYKEVGGAPFLDGQYTVFGEVVEGMDVVDKIAAAQKDQFDRPLEDVKMTVKILN